MAACGYEYHMMLAASGVYVWPTFSRHFPVPLVQLICVFWPQALERVYFEDEYLRSEERMSELPPHRLSRRISDTEKRLLELVFPVQLSGPPGPPKSKEKKEDFYANVGDAIRTLREDVPTCLKDDINCAFFNVIWSISSSIQMWLM